MKGQVFEVMGFVILAIAIIAVIILLRTTAVGGFGKTILALAERHESEGVRSGANALFSMTEEKSGKTIQELVGIAAYVGNDTVDMGPAVGYINVPEEITWRLDALYGKGHWYLRAPYPNIDVGIQIIFVLDTSSSLCDDAVNLIRDLPLVIEKLKAVGKKVTATVYLLEGGSPCCGIDPDPHKPFTISCDKFPQSNYLKCSTIRSLNCKTPLGGQTEEDYGHGTACAIEAGPIDGWQKFSAKVVIPLSDELPMGSECAAAGGGCCVNNPGAYVQQHASLQSGIDAAKKAGVFIFPIKADPGDGCCPTCSGCDAKCNICMSYGGTEHSLFTTLQCQCSQIVSQFMTEMATATGGKMYDLSAGTAIAQALVDVIERTSPKRTSALEAGNKQGYEIAKATKNVRAVNFPLPVAGVGIYTTADIYQWS
jgi:hypothetical protein